MALPTVQSRPEGFTGTTPASGFQGALVISSKRPITASAELLTLSGSRDAYDGVQRGGGSRRIILPYIAKNLVGYNGTIVVQNVGLQPATVHVDYTPGRRGVIGSSASVTLRPGQSHTFRVSEVSIEDATGQFFGSATVVGTNAGDRLAATAIHEGLPPQSGESVNVYNGIGDDQRSDTLYVPLHITWHDRNSLTDTYTTTLAVTNSGDLDTDVEIRTSRTVALQEQSNKPLCPPNGTFVPGTFSVAAGKTRLIGFSNSCKYVGSAVLTSNNGQPLAAAVVQSNVARSAIYTAIPKSEASEEVLLPQIVSQYTAAARYSEIQIQNVDATATQVTIAFAPNRPGGSRPPNMLRQLDAGQTLYLANLANSGLEYLGSATVTTDNHVKLAVVVTELPRDPVAASDPMQTYVGRAPPKSKISMDVVRVPDTPLINPCLPFMEKVRSLRDSPGGSSVYIDPPTLNPLFGFINCFQTEDEEHQQRAQAQGLLLTRELPLFARMDPVIGPLPGLLINTDPLWAAHSSSDNTSIAVIGTSAPSTKSRLIMGDPWAQFAAALAQTMATAAAAALGQGAGDAMVDHLRQFDWLSGPTDLSPSGPSPQDQRADLKRRLIGLGAISDSGEEVNVNRLIASALNSAEATTGNPGPGPDFPCDVASTAGFVTAEILGIASDFGAFELRYTEIDSVSRGFIRLRDFQPKQEGPLNLCKLMRTFAACMRARNLNELEIAHQPGELPQSAVDFLNQHWSGGHLLNPITGTEKWVINIRDRNQRGFSCLFDD